MASTVSMGQYLFKRVAELGIEHVFGVPGDFNREFYLLIPSKISAKTLKLHFWTNFSRLKN
jgi:TPP-dependent 2-oxoacid decarboxylase